MEFLPKGTIVRLTHYFEEADKGSIAEIVVTPNTDKLGYISYCYGLKMMDENFDSGHDLAGALGGADKDRGYWVDYDCVEALYPEGNANEEL